MADERILLKRSGVAGELPLSTQLEFGELAINYADGAIFTKMADGVVRNISGATASNNTIYVRISGDDNNSGADEAQAKRTIKAGLNACTPNTTLDIGPGMFLEDNPMPLPQRCTIHGVDQRITSIVPKNPTKDIFWVSTGCYVTALAYRGHMKPSYCIAFPGNLEIGTAQSAGTGNNTIVLDPLYSVQGPGLEDYYREMRITLTGGTGNGQSKTILTYNTESRMATVNSAWSTPPNNTTTYLIDIAIPEFPSPNTRYSAHITASPYLYNMASVVSDQYISSSGTSLTVSNGTKTLTIGTGFSIAAGRWVRIIHDPFNFMVGTVVSYNSGTGQLVVQVEKNQRQDISARTSWAIYYVCGGGMEMDGFKAAGLRSMVSAQFTQFNQGGDCVVIKNMGYAQLVSIYAINCEDGFLAESGGTASMGNCNVNFGNRGLVANGVGPLLMTASAGFIFNESKCERDTGLIVDSILQDMASDANTQSVFAGLQYWNQAGTTVDVLPLPQKAPTVNTFSYISTLAQKVVQKDTTGTRYQAVIPQNTTGTAATAGEAAILALRYGNIISIINSGTAGVTDTIVPNGILANTNSNNINAYTLLLANKEYLKAEANAYVATVETSVSLNTAMQTKCSRDVGYITDSVAYDLRYGGNKQSIQSGVYYYGYSNTSAIIDQEPQTTGAYNYLKRLISYVVTNTAVPTLYQTAVSQNFSANVATAAQSAIANTYVDTINEIITEGPSEFLQFRYPIPLTVNTNADQIDAVTQLYNNRNFLKREVVAYVGNVWTTNNQTGYTINVSNVTACTDPRFSITANSKPYLGLVMNIDGEKELDIQAGLGYNVGDTLNVAFIGSGYTDRIEGTVTAFDLATTRCTMSITNVVGQTGNIATNWVVNSAPIATSTNGRFRQEVILGVDAGEFANVQAGGQLSFIVDTSLEIPKYLTILAANTVGDVTTLLLDERITTPLPKDKKLYFYQKSTLAASGQTFEFVGSGTSVITALPRNGGDLLQANETVSSNGGIVYFTSTDQFGNFRIGEDLLINFNTGTLSGRAFTRSLFAQITPFVLALDS
jgi:hypothetical protein